MKTIETINQEIQTLLEEKIQIEDSMLNETIYTMFSAMTKEEVLAKIGEMMQASSMLKMEVRRLLIDKPIDILQEQNNII